MADEQQERKAPASLPIQYRSASLDAPIQERVAQIDAEGRIVRDVVFTAGTRVPRWFGMEELSLNTAHIRMGRMKDGAAVLFNHDPDMHIGVTENVAVKGGTMRGDTRFGQGECATEKFRDIQDKILKYTSLGYIVHHMTLTETGTDGDVYLVDDWEPAEISYTPLPAEGPATGVGRSAEAQQFPVLITRNITAAQAAQEQKMADSTPTTAAAVEQMAEVVRDGSDLTRNDAAEIVAAATSYGIDSGTVQNLLRKGATLGEAKEVMADIVLARARAKGMTSGVASPAVEGLTNKERRDYSIVRAIRHLADEDGIDAGLEREVSQEISKRLKRPTNGIYIPTRLNVRGGLDTKTDAAGKYGVATEVRDLIELLRNKTRVIQMGATVLSGLDSTVAFPTQATASAVTWVAENPGSDVADQDATFGQRTMSPKMGTVSTAYSKKLLAQSSIEIEGFVRNDLAAAHALGIDAAAINGLGSSNQPLGLLKTGGIGSVAIGASGGAPTYASIVDLEAAIADANGDESGMKFLTTPVMRGKLRKTEEFATTNGRPVWTGDGSVAGAGSMLGYDAWVSKNVPSTLSKGSPANTDCHAIIFGYWPSLIIGEWGVIEILVDPYRLKKQGMIEVTSYQMVDILLRQPAQFAAIQDARNV